MLTKKQLKVIEVFRKNLGKEITAKEIKEMAGINSNKFLYRAISNCIHEGIIKTKQVGKSLLYRLDINAISPYYLSLAGFEQNKLPKEVINRITNELNKKIYFFIGAIFGSYAKGNAKKDSDIDIVFIFQNKKDTKKAKPILNTLKLREVLTLHILTFTISEFIEMLKVEEENVGKEIVRNHMVFYNPQSFYYLIKPWMLL